jgi:hypothetical protein
LAGRVSRWGEGENPALPSYLHNPLTKTATNLKAYMATLFLRYEINPDSAIRIRQALIDGKIEEVAKLIDLESPTDFLFPITELEQQVIKE